MGDFRIVIEGVGGHGCDRLAKEGEALRACGRADCPDCLAREFVESLKAKMCVNHATLTHWPHHLDHRESGYAQQPGNNIVDDLLKGQRKTGWFGWPGPA